MNRTVMPFSHGQLTRGETYCVAGIKLESFVDCPDDEFRTVITLRHQPI